MWQSLWKQWKNTKFHVPSWSNQVPKTSLSSEELKTNPPGLGWNQLLIILIHCGSGGVFCCSACQCVSVALNGGGGGVCQWAADWGKVKLAVKLQFEVEYVSWSSSSKPKSRFCGPCWAQVNPKIEITLTQEFPLCSTYHILFISERKKRKTVRIRIIITGSYYITFVLIRLVLNWSEN